MKVVLIGDSHSTVTNDYLKKKLEADGHEVPLTLQNVGWSIHTYVTRDALQDVPLTNPDVAIVALGGNNSVLDSVKYGDRMGQFLTAIGYPETKVIWVGPYYSDHNITPKVAKRHDWTQEWMLNNLPSNVAHIDMYPYSQTGHRDGVHFSYSKYYEMMDTAYPLILRAFPRKINPLFIALGLSILLTGVIFVGKRRDSNDARPRIGKVS